MTMRDVLDRLTVDLAARLFNDENLFSIFVNEGSGARDAEQGIEEHCRSLIEPDGNRTRARAGWAAQPCT
jgi:hypothetical protein